MLYAQMFGIRSCDHVTQMAMHVVKIKMATKFRILFSSLYHKLLLEYDPPVSKKCFKINTVDLYTQTDVNKAVGE